MYGLFFFLFVRSFAEHSAVHVGGRQSAGNRLPCGARPERTAALPGHAGAADRNDLYTHQANLPTYGTETKCRCPGKQETGQADARKFFSCKASYRYRYRYPYPNKRDEKCSFSFCCSP